MDPMAPTTLAVNNQFMERIGNGLSLLRDHGKKVQKYLIKSTKFEVLKRPWNTLVNIVLIEARDLPDAPANGNGLYCKFKLGSETHKSKQVNKSRPVWRERFNLHLYEENSLEIKLWHKAKQKNFMGRCTIDLSQLEKERTHDIWQELECGFGEVHLLITLSGSNRLSTVDSVPTTNGIHHDHTDADDKFVWYRLDKNWNEVGELNVRVHGARGLSAMNISGNVSAFCVLELDNSRIQTHTVRGSCDPNWDKGFTFSVNDVTSAIEITVYNESMLQSMKGETIGQVSIPLLRINNNERRWYALKDRAQRSSARGNCPRILLEMSLTWNPVKASLRLLTPKETKYIERPQKFDIPLIYNNLNFIKNIFKMLQTANDNYKLLFEWDNQEKSAVALTGWLVFWYFFRMWMTPLLLVLPFAHYWFVLRNETSHMNVHQIDDIVEDNEDEQKDEKTIRTRLYELQDLTFTIKNSIDYIVSLLEKIKNLVNFSVPYLSYLAVLVLVASSIAFLIIPANYLFMAFGVYKFTRKFLNPQRVPNNDILDFISRIPDNEILKEWRELKVPEPSFSRSNSMKRR